MASPMCIVALDALKSLVFHRFGMKKGFRISPKTLKAESEGFRVCCHKTAIFNGFRLCSY